MRKRKSLPPLGGRLDESENVDQDQQTGDRPEDCNNTRSAASKQSDDDQTNDCWDDTYASSNDQDSNRQEDCRQTAPTPDDLLPRPLVLVLGGCRLLRRRCCLPGARLVGGAGTNFNPVCRAICARTPSSSMTHIWEPGLWAYGIGISKGRASANTQAIFRFASLGPSISARVRRCLSTFARRSSRVRGPLASTTRAKPTTWPLPLRISPIVPRILQFRERISQVFSPARMRSILGLAMISALCGTPFTVIQQTHNNAVGAEDASGEISRRTLETRLIP